MRLLPILLQFFEMIVRFIKNGPQYPDGFCSAAIAHKSSFAQCFLKLCKNRDPTWQAKAVMRHGFTGSNYLNTRTIAPIAALHPS